MTEIIRRESKLDIENLMDKEVQISINDWGHLMFRFFDTYNSISKTNKQKNNKFC